MQVLNHKIYIFGDIMHIFIYIYYYAEFIHIFGDLRGVVASSTFHPVVLGLNPGQAWNF